MSAESETINNTNLSKILDYFDSLFTFFLLI